jgi:hypothetical protein
VASEQEKRVVFHIEVCTFPNWDGQDQTRVVTVSGKELKMTIPAAALGGTNHLIWRRAE